MLYTHRLNKKGIGQKEAMYFLLAIILLVVLIYIGPKFIGQKGAEISALGPSKDKLCKAQSQLVLPTGTEDHKSDVDKDGRDDYLCDNCVCPVGDGCHNDNNDNDGDALPSRCDADDQDKTNKDFHKKNCGESQMINLGTTWGKQCRPLLEPKKETEQTTT